MIDIYSPEHFDIDLMRMESNLATELMAVIYNESHNIPITEGVKESFGRFFNDLVEKFKKFAKDFSDMIQLKIKQRQIHKKLDDFETACAKNRALQMQKLSGNTSNTVSATSIRVYKKQVKSLINEYVKLMEKLKRGNFKSPSEASRWFEKEEKQIEAKFKDFFSGDELAWLSMSFPSSLKFVKSELAEAEQFQKEIQDYVERIEKVAEKGAEDSEKYGPGKVTLFKKLGLKVTVIGKKSIQVARKHPIAVFTALAAIATTAANTVGAAKEIKKDRHPEGETLGDD